MRVASITMRGSVSIRMIERGYIHDLEVLWDGFDGRKRVRCKDYDCEYEGEEYYGD